MQKQNRPLGCIQDLAIRIRPSNICSHIDPPVSTPIATTGDSTATIVSQGMRGYQVFLDGNYIGTEGTGGDPLDGKFSFRVVGNQNHDSEGLRWSVQLPEDDVLRTRWNEDNQCGARNGGLYLDPKFFWRTDFG